MNIQKFSKKALALLLAVLLCTAYLAPAVGQSYAAAHPASVNAGKSDAQVMADDLEQFSKRSGYDYHEAKEGDYAPNELILEITSSPSNAAASISSFEDEFDLKVERVLGTTEFEDEGEAQVSSIDGGESILTTYFMSTEEDDIIALCDALNARDEVFNAQPNFKYEICDETEAADLSQPAEQPEEETSTPQNEADNPTRETQQEPVAQEPTAPQELAATKVDENSIASYTDPAAFSTTDYINNLKWWFI